MEELGAGPKDVLPTRVDSPACSDSSSSSSSSAPAVFASAFEILRGGDPPTGESDSYSNSNNTNNKRVLLLGNFCADTRGVEVAVAGISGARVTLIDAAHGNDIAPPSVTVLPAAAGGGGTVLLGPFAVALVVLAQPLDGTGGGTVSE